MVRDGEEEEDGGRGIVYEEGPDGCRGAGSRPSQGEKKNLEMETKDCQDPRISSVSGCTSCQRRCKKATRKKKKKEEGSRRRGLEKLQREPASK